MTRAYGKRRVGTRKQKLPNREPIERPRIGSLKREENRMTRLIAITIAMTTLAACEPNTVAPAAVEAGDARNDLDEGDPNIKQ